VVTLNDDMQKLEKRVEELEQENKKLSGILKEHGLLEENNEDYPLHNVWFEEGKYAGV
jgi:hypothetical protein